MEKMKQFVRNLIGDGDIDYAQFIARNEERGEVSEFRENAPDFRVFGTGVHVKVAATIAGVIGLMVTIAFCIIYTFYHSRGQGRNEFIDHLELVDLVFAFCFGLPCHYMLFYGIHRENKRFLSPFLVFYCTNFMLNCLFTAITFIAAMLDLHRLLFGQIKYDVGWVVFQILFTSAQGFAIYLVMKCRRYLCAKEHWRRRSPHIPTPSSAIADSADDYGIRSS